MAKRKSSKRVHSAPGVYFKETEMKYATKSLGITTLGLAGETVKGPAFQPISISNWSEFQTYFGGTNTQKFKGSQYPKYELPYIAQEYLKQSKKLEVVRTLGFSGVNAGPAWVITATKNTKLNGYQYTKVENGECKTYNDINLQKGLLSESQYVFIAPAPKRAEEVKEGEKPYQYGETGSNNPLYIIDAYKNNDKGVMFFDDNAEMYFETLPKQLQERYGANLNPSEALESLKEDLIDAYGASVDEKEIIEPCFWVDLSFIKNQQNDLENHGKVALVWLNNENKQEVVEIFDLNQVGGRGINCQESESVDYIFFTKSWFEKKYNNNETANQFYNKSFEVYQYGYYNLDKRGYTILEATGTACPYEYNKTPEDMYFEGEFDYNNEFIPSEYANTVIGVLRSRGEHKHSVMTGEYDECGNAIYEYDGIDYYADKVYLEPITTFTLGDDCYPGYSTETKDFNIDTVNYGKFKIVVERILGLDEWREEIRKVSEYSVSLNPADKNYIIKVLGTDPEVGDAELYVEELYDVALEQLIYGGKINVINSELVNYPAVNIVPDHEPVDDIITFDSSNLRKADIGKRYLYTFTESLMNGILVHVSKNNGLSWETRVGSVGHIYTVVSIKEEGKTKYVYAEYRNENDGILKGNKKFTEYLTPYSYEHDVVQEQYVFRNCVKVLRDNMYYVNSDFNGGDTANEGDVVPITLDFNNYKEEYRYASTPWFVSEIKGSGKNINLHKLFRFHTISDGNTANDEIKISIENIDPEYETFDVVVRSFNDSDLNPNVLERFGKCTLVPGDKNYLGYKVGTLDGVYVSQSAYITVEINEDDITAQSIPAGFLGYPVRNYSGYGIFDFDKTGQNLSTNVKQPYVQFNNTLDEEVSVRKQYFGMSDLIGIDTDVLKYKGVEAYNDDPAGLTPCFHLDARILNGIPTLENDIYYIEDVDGNRQTVSVDGISGYTWVTVDKNLTVENYGIEPRIGLPEVMESTIYEDKAARKFTVCFYGGWDGWDYYRTSRSNGDEFRANKYKGRLNKISGDGVMFSYMKNPETYGFSGETKVISSDYYAYLAAIKQLDNPKTVDINVFATPGIDYVNQSSLVNEVITIIEEERGDALYVVTTPDKPFGAGDSKSEMYTPQEAVFNLEDSDIDSNYVCTYYPWAQYLDQDNNQYIYLPITRDVVRNIAYTDNVAYSWYASAGWNRGDLNCVAPKRKLKLAEQDTLYDGRINYVNSFAQEGNKIWGDKNLQVHEGIMNRISKRRLLLRLKRELSVACVGLLFDPNDATMGESLKSAIKSVLEPIQVNRGIIDFKIELDESAEAKDRLELPAKVWIKPTQMLEYIPIELAVTPNGVSFE